MPNIDKQGEFGKIEEKMVPKNFPFSLNVTDMDESVINTLFMRVAGNASNIPEETRAVFSILVSSTLQYRDYLKESMGIIVTVEDVRVVLKWLLETMRSKRLPETDNAVRLDLLKIWMDELAGFRD